MKWTMILVLLALSMVIVTWPVSAHRDQDVTHYHNLDYMGRYMKLPGVSLTEEQRRHNKRMEKNAGVPEINLNKKQEEAVMGWFFGKMLTRRPYLQCHKYDWQCIEERDRRERENIREFWELILKNK